MRTNAIEVKSIDFAELRKLFDKKIFAIPDIQREFVWTKQKIIRLLDSIFKLYPIGSFLICKIPARQSKNIRESAALPMFDYENNDTCYLVIDGHQRLSVLYAAIHGTTIKPPKFFNPINLGDICLARSARNESAFEFYSRKGKDNIEISRILNKDVPKNQGRNKRKRIQECFEFFQNYKFPFIFINGYNGEKMKQAFVRLNTGGTSLSTVDKFFAESYHKDTDLRRHVNNLLIHKLRNGFQNIDRIHIVKSIAANLGVKDFVGSSLNSFARQIAKPKSDFHIRYVKNRKKIENSITCAADYLSRLTADPSYLPYPAMLSVLSAFYYNNGCKSPTKPQMSELNKWFWTTGFTQRYTGKRQRYSLINDVDQMKQLANKGDAYTIDLQVRQSTEPVSVIQMLRKTQYHSQRGAIRNTFFCYLISKKPREFNNGAPMEIKGVSSIFNAKNDHHIFPKRVLRKYVKRWQINSLGNICFLNFGENSNMKAKEPWVYLRKYKENKDFGKILASHVIPNHSCVLKMGDVRQKYEEFLQKRCDIVKRDLIGLIGSKNVED